MKLTPSFTLAISGTLLLTACAAVEPSTSDYARPEPIANSNNEVVIDNSFDAVWNEMVKNLSDSFFVINNIDRESRLINLSFSADDPTEYIDCGTTTRDFEHKGKTETYKYPVAGDNTYKMMKTWNPPINLPLVYEIFRDSQLEGRINVYVAPLGETTTELSVNTRYVYSVQVSGTMTAYNAFGTPVGTEPLTTETYEGPAFNTGQTGTSQNPSENITCTSNGTLEERLLRMATG